MIWSNLVKSACVAIALSGFSAPPAGALEMQGSNPTARLNDGLISKVVVYHRGATVRGPHGGVYHRGGTYHGYPGYRGGYGYHGYHGGVYRGGYLAAGRGPAGITGSGRRYCGRRRSWRARRRRGCRLCGPAAGAGPMLVLHRSELPRGLLGRLLAAR